MNQSIMNYSRDTLYNRHRLSHHQINNLLEEQQNQLVFEEKIHLLELLSGFLEIADYLQEENIWFLPLKGPLLSYRIYGDATCRRYRDFDILVKPESVSRVIDLFCMWGYEYDKKRWPEAEHKQAKKIRQVNQLTLYCTYKQQIVEIHWRVFIDPIIDYHLITEIVNKNIQKTEFAGRIFNRFSIEFELFYLIIHGGLHTWRRLKWLLDVHEILARYYIDKSNFENLVTRFSAQRLMGLCNEMLRHFFPGSPLLPVDYPVPEWFHQYARQQVYKNQENPEYVATFSLKHRWYYINAFPGLKYKQKRILLLASSIKKLKYSLTHD